MPIDEHGLHLAALAHSQAANAGADPTACLQDAIEAYHAHLEATGQLAPAAESNVYALPLEAVAQMLGQASGHHRYGWEGWRSLVEGAGEMREGPIEHAAKEALARFPEDRAMRRWINDARLRLLDAAREQAGAMSRG